METISVVLTIEIQDLITCLLDAEVFPNKSELIRAAIREFLYKHGAFSE